MAGFLQMKNYIWRIQREKETYRGGKPAIYNQFQIEWTNTFNNDSDIESESG